MAQWWAADTPALARPNVATRSGERGSAAGRLRRVAVAVVCIWALAGLVGAPTPTRAATADSGCSQTLQSLIDAAPAASTLVVPPCIYRESVTISKPLTLDGSGVVIDGRDPAGVVVRDSWMTIAASDVTVRGFTMRYADNAPQTGALRLAAGISGVTIEDCDLGFAAGADVALGLANGATLTGCAIHDAGQLGVHVGGDGTNGRDNIVQGNRIFHNNTAGYDIQWEAGGLKATQQSDLTIADNTVYDNDGPGLWCDIYCRDTTVRGNSVYDNTGAGILMEVSTGGLVTANNVWSDGWVDPDWCWGAGIVLSSSGGLTVTDNVIAWNAAGISVLSQDRTDWAHHATDVTVADNTVAATQGRWLECWAQDWNGELFLTSSDNHGQGDRFWAATRDAPDQFAWDGVLPNLAAFSKTPGGVGASYLTTDEMVSLLGAAGVPTAASGEDVPAPLPAQLAQKAIEHPIVLVAAASFVIVLTVFGLIGFELWRRRRRSTAQV